MASRSPIFRVETYEISATEFTGTTYRLYLRHELAANYVPMLCWGVASDGVAYALSDLFVRVSADPYGTGDLSLSDGNYLELIRGTANYPAKLQVVVVECLTDEQGAGFTLLDVQATSLAATASTGVQSTTDTSGTAWIDSTRVALFGGYRGGGLSSATASSSSGQVQTGGVRIYPSSTATLNLDRFASGASNLAAAVCTTYVVEWGVEWLVQRATVTGTNTGATLASTGHYSTATPTRSMLRAATWIWACGYTNGSGPGDSFLGQVATLGDGVSTSATETTVAVGGMATVTTRSFEVYALSHPSLSVEYDFRATGSGSGASSLTVASPGSDESYRTASWLYGVSTAGERSALVMAGVTSTTTSNMSEVLVSARPTASTTVTATPADTSPSLSWAGWNLTVDWSGVDLPAGESPVFRVTTYQIPTGVFTGTTYDLTLLYDLSTNYFAQVVGGAIGSTTQDADDAGAYVSQDPFGTGDLTASSGSKVIRLTRAANSEAWVGTVTVWECLTSSDQHGFQLIDVLHTALPAISVDYQQVDDTTNAVWTDLDRVTLHAGYQGGGCAPTAGATTAQHNSLAVLAVPSGTSTIRFKRYPGTALVAVQVCTYVVQWGSAWDVQRVALNSNLSGSAVDATTEYATVNLPRAVTASKSMVFFGGLSDTATAGKAGFAYSVMLGDGVTEGGTQLAVGRWVSSSLTEGVAYVLSHDDLVHEADFVTSSTSSSGTATVASPVRGEHAGTLSSVVYTAGRRLVLPHFANSSTSTTNMTVGMIQARPTAYTTATWNRDRSDSINVAGWLHTLDLGAITAPTEAIQVESDFDSLDLPVGYFVFQDPHWEGAGNITSVTSEGGAVFGLVEADTTNRGAAYAYQEGEPTGTTDLTLRTQGGAPGGAGGWLYRLGTETTAADWKGMNGLTVLTRSRSVTTSVSLDAHALVYSRSYDRVIVAWISDASTVAIRHRPAGTPLATSSSTTFTVTNADATGPATGMDMCELPDDALLCCIQTATTQARDMDLYRSSDGGLTWSMFLKGVQRRIPGSVGYSGNQGQHTMRSSADYVRIVYEQTTAGTGNTTLYDLVSADRGASWKTVGTLTAYTFTGIDAGHVGSSAWDIVGLGDVAGTFLFTRASGVSGTTVQVHMAAGTEAFERIAALDFDISGYATSARIKGLWWCRIPDHVLLFCWIEGSDASEIIVRKATLADVTSSASWTTLGRITGFSGVLNYGPHKPRAVWAGNQVVISAGLHDPTVAVGADPVVNGHWSFTIGGWDTKPLGQSLLDPGSEWYFGDAAYSRLIEYQWSSCLNRPTADGLTPWTFTGAATVAWTSDAVNITTSTIAVSGRYNLIVTPGSDSDAWGVADTRGFVFDTRMKVTSQRSTTLEDVGIRIMAPTTSGTLTTGYDVTIRTCTTQVEVYDNNTASALATISTTDFASEVEVRVTISGTSIWLAWRKVSSGQLAAWTEYGSYTLTVGMAIAGQVYRVGIIDGPAAAGTSTVDVYEVKISRRSDLGQQGTVTKPDDLFGALMTQEPVLTAGGAWVGWGGGGAPTGDTFTATVEATNGIPNLGIDSPSYYWESLDLSQNALVFDASTASASGARWQMDALALIGTVDRTCTLEFSDTATWTTPAASVELDATLWDDLTVVAVDGAAVQLEAPTGEVFLPSRGELLGAVYVRFTTAGTASGKTYLIKADQFSDDGWVVVDDGVDLATAGVTVGAKACLFADRMVFLGLSRYRYRYFRLVFPDVSSVSGSLGTATGTHRLGALVPGHHLELNRQTGGLRVEYTDTEEPLTTTSRAKSGIENIVQDGPATRSIGMSVQAANPAEPSGPSGDVARMIRDILRVAHSSYTRPVGLVMDVSWRSRANVLFGTLNLDGTTIDQGVSYKPEDGSKRFHTVGDIKLRLDERG